MTGEIDMELFDNEKVYLIKKKVFYVFVAIILFFTMIYLSVNGLNSSDLILKIRIIALVLSIVTLLIMYLIVHDMYLHNYFMWSVGFMIATGYLTMLILEISNFSSNKMPGYIIIIILELAFVIVYLWISKVNFGRFTHTMNILLLSTYSLVILSVVFSSYYVEIYDIIYNFDRTNALTRILSYCKISMRFYFEFPPDEYLDIFTFFQFIIGKIYEAVLIGGVASLVVKTVGSSDD